LAEIPFCSSFASQLNDFRDIDQAIHARLVNNKDNDYTGFKARFLDG
jgi:hypothetical protein